MIPPVTTRQLQRAIETKRRAEAAERWTRAMAAATHVVVATPVPPRV